MEPLSTKEKDAIREALRIYVAKYPSQNKAAGSLKNTSVGTISSIMNGSIRISRTICSARSPRR